MDERDIEQIEAFLASVGAADLWAYLQTASNAPPDEVEAAIKRRRQWAQGQQANPKYRAEALWVIKNQRLLNRVLLEEADAYREAAGRRVRTAALQALMPFIQGAVAGGSLTPEAELAIYGRARELHIPDDDVREAIVQAFREEQAGGRPAVEEQGASFDDWYALLQVPFGAPLDAVETAHRERYRWARNLSDKARASTAYAQLDEAWRVLSTPDRRTAYDGVWLRRNQAAAPATEAEPARPAPPQPPPVQDLPGAVIVPKLAETSSAPRPPDNIGGGVAPGAPRGGQRSRLEVVGPDTVELRGQGTVQHRLVVKNLGSRRMPGQVSTNKSWLKVEPTRLDPDAVEQALVVTVDSRRMPRREALALLTVSTDQGERRTITFKVRRRSLLPALVALVIAVALGVASWLLLQRSDRLTQVEPQPPALAPASLEVLVDPPADTILVDGRAVGSGERFVVEGVEPGREVTVRVECDGFTPAERAVTAAAGRSQPVKFELPLEDPMTFLPRAGVEGRIDAGAVEQAFEGRQHRFDACFDAALADRPGFEAELGVLLVVSGVGRVRGFEVASGNVLDTGVADCVKRESRAVTLPFVLAGDYVRLERTFRRRIPEDP